jgi:Rrf2 family protein
MAAFQISRKVDYALRALIYLARHGGESACTLGTIAADIDVSPQFLAKIVEELGHRGLVRSRRGSRGGYVLGRAAAAITFNDVIEAVEGPIALNICLDGQGDCTLLGACGMQPVWQEAQRRLVDVFAQTTLADVGAACQGGCAPNGRSQTLAVVGREPGTASGARGVAPLVADPERTTGVPSGRGGS